MKKHLAIPLMIAAVLHAEPTFCAAQSMRANDSYTFHQLKIGGGGYVTGLVAHPTVPGVMYIRTDIGGAYRWNAQNQSWKQLVVFPSVPAAQTQNNNDYNVESIALSAKDDRVVYIAIGADSYDPSGVNTSHNGRILKSTNYGKTWTDSGQNWFMAGNGDARQGGERLAVDPNNGNVVYFGSRLQGLWQSVDGAKHWAQVYGFPTGSVINGTPYGVKFVTFDRTSGTLNGRTKRIYAGVGGNGVYLSDDAGQTWSLILNTYEPFDGKVGSDGTFVVGLGNSDANGTLQSYNPTTGAWTNIAPSGGTFWSFAIDPFNSKRLIAGAGGISAGNLFQTLNGGQSWTTYTTLQLSSPDIPWIANTDEVGYMSSASMQFDPFVKNRLWFPEGAGVWQNNDQSQPTFVWAFASKGIEQTDTTDVIAPTAGHPVTAIFDRQGFYSENVNQYPAQPLIDGIFYGGASLGFSAGNPDSVVTAQVKNNVYPPTSRGGYSANGGATWNLFPTVPAQGVGGNIAVSATDPKNVVWLPSNYQFGQGLPPYTSHDLGTTWTQSSGITTLNTHWFFYWGTKKALDSDKVTGGKFYVVTFEGSGGFYVSTDGGATFTPAANAPVCSLNDNCHVFGVVRAVPGYANNVWSSDSLGGLYSTTDAGATPWTKVSHVDEADAFGFGKATQASGYPAVYVAGVVDGTRGLWRSDDQGNTWSQIASFPLGLYDEVDVVNGDMNKEGRVYVGFQGNGFVYGDRNK